jgi:hypothetical protein
MHRIVTSIFVGALLIVAGCVTHQQSAKIPVPTTTPYDTNVVARAVYLQLYGDAYRVAAAGRTNITYDYRGEHVRAATDGQWQGVHAGLQVVRERGLQQLRRGPQLPRTTPFDGEREARAAYLRSYRDNYLGALSGRHTISCFPQTRTAEAYCRGERDGQRKAMDDTYAVEKRWLAQYSALSDCMVKQQPEIRYGPRPSVTRSILKAFGL